MTDCAVAAPTTRPRSAHARRSRRALPACVPRWAWLLGVTVLPLEGDDPDAPRTWVLSAGAGTSHTTALLHDGPDADRRC